MNGLAEIVGDSAGIRRLREQLEQILTRAATARRPPPILLRGETGTGKGLVARTLHRAGPRARAPFVDVNCSAIPETLLEAELFGYERGAFTDARQAKPGLFQLAHRGMLFLDEIGMLSPALQAKLLKVLEDGVVRRLGGTRPEPIDVWVVSATNEDLAESLRARRFREDLYHRLAVLSLELPPLRERGPDVVVLADRFLARACADYGLPPKTFARDARAALGRYAWPGNVRELGNVVERVALLADEPVVTAAMLALPDSTAAEEPPSAEPARPMSSRDQMRAHLIGVLTETGGNISQTALRLGVARNTVLARMARFGLTASTAAPPAAPRPAEAPRRHAAATARTDAPTPLFPIPRVAWEQRRVALLRVDVVVSAAAGSWDASRALDEMIGKAQIFGGDIVELGPGAFVAVFGLEAVEDAPVRAALAALAILNATERAKSDGGGPRVKIVVHVTQVLVSQHQAAGSIDLESKRAAWTTIEALVALDALDTIVVSEASAPFLERPFELTPASANGTTAVPFRRLTRRERTGFGLGGRPLSRFVGRDGDLRLVRDRLADAARGRGQVIGIVGEPGVGKSRFVYELTRIDPTHGWRVLGGHGASHGSTTPFLAVSDLLRRYFTIEDADEPEVIREKVTETVLSRHEQLRRSLAPLLSLLDIPDDDPSWASLDPPERRQRMQDATKLLLLHESRIQPLLLIVEDLQWIDAETQALLDGLVESLPTAKLLLLINYRPEYQHRWGSKTYYSQLRLDALPPEGAGELIDALLGEDPGLEPLKQLLVRRGNPFFIEEIIRTLVETQALVGERGAHRLTRSVQAIEVPATVQVILAARIDRLPTEDKQLLQTASVIGKDVPLALLQAVAGTGEDEVSRGLAHLRAAEFLYETRLFPDDEYTFKHTLTYEVTYGTLLPDRRKALHARIVAGIERLYPDRLGEHVERLAHHAVRGEVWPAAVRYLRQAGTKAFGRSANRESAAYLEQALVALAHLPDSRDTIEQAVDTRLDLRNSLQLLGDLDAVMRHLREAEVAVRALDDPWRLGWWSTYMGHYFWITGRATEARDFGERSVELARQVADLPLRVVANLYYGLACVTAGDYPRAEAVVRTIVDSLEGDLARERFGQVGFPVVTSRCYLVYALAERGEFAEGIALGREGLRLARELDHPYSIGLMSWNLARLYILKGEVDAARALIEESHELSRQGNFILSSPRTIWSLGHLAVLEGRIADGLVLLEQALEAFESVGMRVYQSLVAVDLGAAYGEAGRLDEARACVARALALAREREQRGHVAYALHLAGDLAARAADAVAADASVREALALADELGMRPLAARCHLSLGTLDRGAGHAGETRAHLETAIAMFAAMEMGLWRERAERARAQFSV